MLTWYAVHVRAVTTSEPDNPEHDNFSIHPVSHCQRTLGLFMPFMPSPWSLGGWISRVFPQPTVDILHLFTVHTNTTHRGTSSILSSFRRSAPEELTLTLLPLSSSFKCCLRCSVWRRQSSLQACCMILRKARMGEHYLVHWEDSSICQLWYAGTRTYDPSLAHDTRRRPDSKTSWQ